MGDENYSAQICILNSLVFYILLNQNCIIYHQEIPNKHTGERLLDYCAAYM